MLEQECEEGFNECDQVDQDLARLLTNHYGDGSVYLPVEASNEVLKTAIKKEYINEGGYLTRKGRKFVSKHSRRYR